MTCPDINRLIDLALGGEMETELRAHVETCAKCSVEMRLIREIPAAFAPEVDVSDALVRSVMVNLPSEAVAREGPRRVPAIHVVMTGVLGAITTAAAIVATGTTGSGDPVDLLAFCVATGVVCSLILGRQEEHPPVGPV